MISHSRGRLQKVVRISVFEKAEDIVSHFGRGGRALFVFLSALIILSGTGLLYTLNRAMLTEVPAHGGTMTEGIIGSPRFINPILAISDTDRDLSALVYSGLITPSPEGTYLPNLAEHFDISENGRVYTVYLRKDAVFHDGEAVLADDVLFTIQKAQDPAIKSPLRANWSGVTVEKVDDRTVRFTLRSAYAPFIEDLAIGILPKHLWKNIGTDEFPFSELNTSPVGSGPYMIDAIARDTSGIPSSYTLKSFSRYALGEPYLSTYTFKFYQSEEMLVDALSQGKVEAASGISPDKLGSLRHVSIQTSSLNRVFGVFFNQNQTDILRDAAVRKALNHAINRDALINDVMSGYATAITSPVPPNIARSTATYAGDPAAAKDMLLAAGWKEGEDGVLTKTSGSGKTASTRRLAFSLATANVPELRRTAEFVQQAWRAMGADVSVAAYDPGDLSENIIRPRKYDALLFGEIVGRGLDLSAFWASSERNDPGLNIALYTNPTVDSLLEKLRSVLSDRERADWYEKFIAEINNDVPAVFLYAPDFVYVVPENLQGLTLSHVATPSDRFLSVYQWYRRTDAVWPFFLH